MPIDSSIYNMLGRGVKSVADYDAEAQALQQNALALKQGQMNLLSGQMKQDEYTRGVREAETIRGALAGLGGDATDDARIRALKGTGLPGGFSQADALQKAMLERDKTKAEVSNKDASTAKYQAETMGVRLNQYRDALERVNNPQAAAQWLKAQYDDPVIGQFIAGMAGPFDQALQRMTQHPAGFEDWRNRAGMGIEKFMADQRVRAQQAETGRHNLATEGVQQGQLGVSRGQLAVAQGNLGLSRERLNVDKAAPKGEVIQTEQGPMLLDKRTGVTRPVLGPDGETLGPKLKDAPAAVQKAMIENGTNLRRAERALALVQGNDVGEAKGDKAATGLKGYLPNQILNRIDPAGVDARAQIADLGSLVIHDRSGAAVTASEFPRLAPFIPTEKDDNASAQKKLKRFVQVYKEEIEATQQAYGPGSGFRQLGGAKPAAKSEGGFDADKERRYQEWKAKQQ